MKFPRKLKKAMTKARMIDCVNMSEYLDFKPRYILRDLSRPTRERIEEGSYNILRPGDRNRMNKWFRSDLMRNLSNEAADKILMAG